MKSKIDKNLEYLSQLTKEEADWIVHILKWDDEQKLAFMTAKKIFEENLDADES
jgi:hypothetical protein